MNQFLVPQFIDVEPKIFGPITVRQFIIMLLGMVMIFVEYKTLDFWAFIATCVLTFGLSGVIAFLRVNGQPFHFFVLNIIETLKRPQLAVWQKVIDSADVKAFLSQGGYHAVESGFGHKKTIESSHLDELSLVVNTGGAYQASIEEEPKYEEPTKEN